MMINRLLKNLVRKKTPVNFVDFNRNKPISPVFGLDRGTPIDRHYIEKFLKKNSKSHYSKPLGGVDVEAIDVLHATPDNPKATIVGDLTDTATLPENKIDCFICTQTFNFIYDLQKAVEGAHHLLKPGGVLLATVAGLCQISRYDMDRWGDYWRFTTASANRLFEPVFKGGVEVESYGNVLAATALLQGVAVEDLPDSALLVEHDPDYQVLITIVARKAI
jgi:SAM-dependent methyltransferase